MPDIADIKDRDSLKAWLNAVPETHRQDWAVFIASRVATRVASVTWEEFRRAGDRGLTDIGAWRAVAIPKVSARVQTLTIGLAAANAEINFSEVAESLSIDPLAYTAGASISFAVGTAADDDSFVHTSCDAAYSAAFSYDIWHTVQSDAKYLADGGSVFAFPPLWPKGTLDPFKSEWNAVENALRSTGNPEHWQFWIDWYEAERDGRPMLPTSEAHWEMLAEIFEVSETSRFKEEDWEKGADHINPLIHEIYQRWQLLSRVREIKKAIAAVEKKIVDFANRQHNLPTELRDEPTELIACHAFLKEQLEEIEAELDTPKPNLPRLRKLGERLQKTWLAFRALCGRVGLAFTMAAAGAAGTVAGSDGVKNIDKVVEFVRDLTKFSSGGGGGW